MILRYIYENKLKFKANWRFDDFCFCVFADIDRGFRVNLTKTYLIIFQITVKQF